MKSAIWKLLKNIFSGKPFEQNIVIEFTIYDILFIAVILFLIIRIWI